MKSLRSYNEVVLSRSGAFNTIDPNSEEPACCKMIILSVQEHRTYIYILTFRGGGTGTAGPAAAGPMLNAQKIKK